MNFLNLHLDINLFNRIGKVDLVQYLDPLVKKCLHFLLGVTQRIEY